MKYLTLIRTVAFVHQHQREVKTTVHQGGVVPYIEVTLDDITLANRLAHQVLGRSLDELAPQTRRLLMALDAMVSEVSKAQATPRSEVRLVGEPLSLCPNCISTKSPGYIMPKTRSQCPCVSLSAIR